METSHSLQATESFSYSWLPTTESTIAYSKSCRLFLDDELETQNSFDFNISISKTSLTDQLVHADKLFSNGLIMARSCFDNEDDEPSRSTTTTTTTTGEEHNSDHNNNGQIVCSKAEFRFRRIVFLKKLWSKFPKRIIGKYIKCLIPSKSSRGSVISSNRVDDVNRRAWEVTKSWSNSNRRESVNTAACSSSPRSDTDESSINEAILYCKRSSSGVCS